MPPLEPQQINLQYLTRQERLIQAMPAHHLDVVALNPGPSLEYLSGLKFHLSERPVVALLIPGQPLIMILPELESAKLASLPYPVQSYTYGEDPKSWSEIFKQAFKLAGVAARAQIGVEPRQLRILEYNLIQSAIPHGVFQSAETLLASLRICKDETEIMAMRKAVEIAQQALLSLLPAIKIGMTEREVAALLTIELLQAGSDAEMPFVPIVSCGENSANPHASPSHRRLSVGDLLVIDWGARYMGYCSDLTRTFAIGKVAPELQRIAAIVQEANAAGRAAA